ncbi:polyribonucleotide nucleotidyltransferase 1, chloroplastic-like [Syzygium oleosum]|uniref:polyribonucleotide nucleotidyltransferase 1, chloroplastic-like n=1 Tax=Syzygium oleosum TaxID=219896 RepID=UPI0024BB36A3|nr:polyribonucleotide nucleotidyltransferase 1, chloroplastic-like [Syzygium oleosum]
MFNPALGYSDFNSLTKWIMHCRVTAIFSWKRSCCKLLKLGRKLRKQFSKRCILWSRSVGSPKCLTELNYPLLSYISMLRILLAGNELLKVLQIKGKAPRRKSLASLEDKVLTVVTEKGYNSKDATFIAAGTIPDMVVDEDEEEEVVIDREIDEGDVHIKPVSRKSTPVSL